METIVSRTTCKDYIARQLKNCPVKIQQKPADVFTIPNCVEVHRLVNRRLHGPSNRRLLAWLCFIASAVYFGTLWPRRNTHNSIEATVTSAALNER